MVPGSAQCLGWGLQLSAKWAGDNDCSLVCGHLVTHRQKSTIHQLTTMLSTSENVLFPGHNHPANHRYWWPDTLITTWALVSSHRWLAGWSWLRNRTFLEVDSMAISWWIVAFLPRVLVRERCYNTYSNSAPKWTAFMTRPMDSHTNSSGMFLVICNHQADSPFHLWPDVQTGDLHALNKDCSYMTPNILTKTRTGVIKERKTKTQTQTHTQMLSQKIYWILRNTYRLHANQVRFNPVSSNR